MRLAVIFTAFIVVSCSDCKYRILESGISDFDRMSILLTHNSYRRKIAVGNVTGQPKSSNMLQMQWDDSLAENAQKIADTCHYQHVTVNDTRFPVGQNLYIWMSNNYRPGTNWPAVVKAWFDEVSTYKFGIVQYNHYTQVVWANTYLVGCGYSNYRMKNQKINKKFYVCNYGPAGNVLSQEPYRVGVGCEDLCTITDKKL